MRLNLKFSLMAIEFAKMAKMQKKNSLRPFSR